MHLAPLPFGDDETRFFEQRQVLHDAEAGHPPLADQCGQGETVFLKKPIEQAAACRVGQGLEHVVHAVS